MPQCFQRVFRIVHSCTSENLSRTENISKEKNYIQYNRKAMITKALDCDASRLPYKCAGIIREALWQIWQIDPRRRFSYYRRRLSLDNQKTIFFEQLELKLALALSLFVGDTAEEACEAMYAYGHPIIYVPKRFFTNTAGYLYACYRVIRIVYIDHSVSDSDDWMTREKKRVERLIAALEYIQNEENGEQDLCTYFFGE